MTRPPYIVDGVDFTDYVNRWQYSVGYVYREGSNAALRLSCLQPRDLLAIKTRVTVTVNDQQGPQLAALLTAVLVQLTGTLTTITVQQTLYGKQKDGQTS